MNSEENGERLGSLLSFDGSQVIVIGIVIVIVVLSLALSFVLSAHVDFSMFPAIQLQLTITLESGGIPAN